MSTSVWTVHRPGSFDFGHLQAWTKTRARTSWLLLFRYSVTGPDSAPLLPDAAILSWSFFLAVCVRACGAGSV